MPIELKVPEIGESITEVEIGEWLKKEGDAVKKDDPVVTLESEKATVELSSPEAGTVSKMLKQKGDVAKVGEVIGYLENGKGGAAQPKAEATPPQSQTRETPPPAPEEKKATAPEPKPERPTAARTTEPSSKEKPRSQRRVEA